MRLWVRLGNSRVGSGGVDYELCRPIDPCKGRGDVSVVTLSGYRQPWNVLLSARKCSSQGGAGLIKKLELE